jgi:TonB family protein
MSLLTFANLLSWSLQVGAIVASALIALRLLRLDAPAVRYQFLRTVLVVCLLLPFVQPYAESTPLRAVTTDRSSARVASANGTVQQDPATLSLDRRLRDLAGASWPGIGLIIAAGAIVRCAWILAGIVSLRRLRRAGELAADSDEHAELQAIVRTTAAIRYVDGLGQPVTFGFWRPVVLLPETLKSEPDSIRRAVLAHELWHVRRRDWIWTVSEEALRAAFWFHPAVWLLLSAIQSSREEVVDELTILATGSRKNYLNALLTYADRPPLMAATAFARRRHLMHRVMLISKEAVMSARRIVVCGFVLVAVVAAAGYHSSQAFPFTQAVAAQSAEGPGPIEQRARPVTPENPIPRRTFHVPAEYPPEASDYGVRGSATIQLTIDETGRVAETRVTGFRVLRLSSGPISTRDSAERTAQMLEATQAMMNAATNAAAQWLYAPPADGPLSFPVTIPVGPADVMPPPPPPPPPTVQARSVPPPPPPPPPGATMAWESSEGALRVGGSIKPPIRTHNVNPVYPQEARAARIEGIVILEARIETDGRVSQVRVLRSVPELDEAAVEAVKQWQYTPTLMNGVPVPVIITTTVNFSLR